MDSDRFLRPAEGDTLSSPVLVVGGSTAAYSASLAALEAGTAVLLVQPTATGGGPVHRPGPARLRRPTRARPQASAEPRPARSCPAGRRRSVLRVGAAAGLPPPPAAAAAGGRPGDRQPRRRLGEPFRRAARHGAAGPGGATAAPPGQRPAADRALRGAGGRWSAMRALRHACGRCASTTRARRALPRGGRSGAGGHRPGGPAGGGRDRLAGGPGGALRHR